MRNTIRGLCAAAVAVMCAASHAAPELGVYRWDAPSGPANVDGFSAWLGQPVAVAASFEARNTWDDIDGASWQLQPWSSWVRAQPRRNLSLAVPMLPASGGSLANCAAGQYDRYWQTLANELNYYGLHWAYLRLGWEMDGGWYAWSASPGSGREASYAGCFRRIVTVMRQAQPANQWKFVLNPTANWRSKSYLDAIWPGDAYVDVIGLDLYDQSWASNTYPYPSSCDATCRATRQQNAWNDYSWHINTVRDFAVAHGKKIAFPEWGVAIRPDGHGGGDNPGFIRKMYDFMHNPANPVAYHVYWDVQASDLQAQLSGSTKFPQSAAMFKQLFGAAPAPGPAPTPDLSASFKAPAANGTIAGSFSNSSVCELTGTGISSVQFFLDSTALNTESAAPWNCSIDTRKFADGSHTLKAVARNAAGATVTVAQTVNVQNAAAGPTVSFKAPTAGATLSGSFSNSSKCEVTGSGINRVQFYLDSTALNTESSAPWNCSIDTRRFSNGSHTLKAVASNSAGGSTTITRTVNVRN